MQPSKRSRRLVAKLSLAFSGLALVLVCVTWLGLSRMSRMRSELNTIVTQRWEHTELSAEALRLSSANNRLSLLMLTVDDRDEIERLLERRQQNSTRISELIRLLRSNFACDQERELLDIIEARRLTYIASYQDATRILLQERNAAEARRRMTEEVIPLLNTYHEAWEAFRRFQSEETKAVSRIIQDRFVLARQQLISLLAIGIGLSGAIAAFVTRGLLREIEAQHKVRLLEETREELERRVAERTTDIKRANADLQSAAVELSTAHENLRASEARFRTLSDSAPIGVFLTDGAGTILYRNPYCRRFSDIETETIAPDAWMRCLHPNDVPRVSEAMERSRREAADFECEYRFVLPDGQVRWVHSRASVLRGPNGEVKGRVGTALDITDRKQAETELERVHKELLKASREAGIAEVATGVLHNVKNVINSMNVSATVIESEVDKLPAAGLEKVGALLAQHSSDLATYLGSDPKGRLIPSYLQQLGKSLSEQRRMMLEEVRQFRGNVEHVKEVVSMQQTYATRGSAIELVDPLDVMEDSLRFNLAALSRHGILVQRDYEPGLPKVWVEKHKALQILVNFIRNAKHACQAAARADKKLVVRATQANGFVVLAVSDNGVGIAPEHFQRLFEHGFTTKKDGHGFGLHSAAMAARDMGGSVEAHSDGPGAGACFTLRLPISRKGDTALISRSRERVPSARPEP